MPQQWRIRVDRFSRHQLPVLTVRLNGWLDADVVLSTGEPMTSLAPQVADDLLRSRPMPRGRRVIPSDSGRVIARTLRLPSLVIRTLSGRPIELAPWPVAIAIRPQALGVGGLLGTDFLGRFKRIEFEFGPPDTLLLETDS